MGHIEANCFKDTKSLSFKVGVNETNGKTKTGTIRRSPSLRFLLRPVVSMITWFMNGLSNLEPRDTFAIMRHFSSLCNRKCAIKVYP